MTTGAKLRRTSRRSAFEIWALEKSAALVHRQHGRRKQQLIGALHGTVVELGPGTGANMRYYASGVHVIAIEPNPAMHPRLIANAAAAGVDVEVRELRGERLDLADHSADAVVSTMVLCGVDDPAQVLREVRRVLRPGGTFVFLDHVVAPAGSWTRRCQAVVKRPHRWLFNGCEVDRDIAVHLEAAGFSSLELDRTDGGPGAGYVRHQIIGSATT